MKRVKYKVLFALFVWVCLPMAAEGQMETGEGPNLGPMKNRIAQEDMAGGKLSLREIQTAGMRVFTTPFNKHDGYGDGPNDPSEGDPREMGNRPTLQGNGTFLRFNGLDGQTCLECHFITSNSTIPAIMGIGGVGGGASNASFMPRYVDVAEMNPGEFNGRFINPLFLFGSGGVELVAKEMTRRLQELKDYAKTHPGKRVDLNVNGVNFGRIFYAAGRFYTTEVEGIDPDLVVRPFGRKGEFTTVRAFDLVAMMFHFGIQPVEVVGENVDGDGDSVVNEILPGEISALHIFETTLPKPEIAAVSGAGKGFMLFTEIGCATCHIPFFKTQGRNLTYSYPEVETDPDANVYHTEDLVATAGFTPADDGGIYVMLFSDLKRHDMGEDLAEDFDLAGDATNRIFITARLWGVRDTAPYLHDGRATTITEAILMHGGEAQPARDRFDALDVVAKNNVLALLYSLRTPISVGDFGTAEAALLTIRR